MKRGPAALAACAFLILVQACSRDGPAVPACRMGVAPLLLPVLEQGPPAGPKETRFVSLRPYERARDLEVLLFSSRSPVFQGIVLPGRWAPLLKSWTQAFPESAFHGIRPDVTASLRSAGGLMAAPLTLDGVLIAYREDLWTEFGIPPPKSLAALREAALVLRSRAKGLDRVIGSDVPSDQLFWALAWSYEGGDSTVLYNYPKVHALKFIQEFDLVQEGRGPSGEQLMAQGRCAAIFCSGDTARRLSASGAVAGGRVRVARVPGLHPQSHCIYNGWCLARPSGSPPESSGWAAMAEKEYQGYLASRGFVPVLREEGPPPDEVAAAFRQTVFHSAPDLGAGGDEVVLGAILDATLGPMAAEESLRRGEARLGGSRP